MKAVLCKSFGGSENLTVEEVTPPTIEPGKVRIAVHACGVNFPDTLIIRGKYQFKPEFPFSPGGEVAGEVIEAGPGVTRIKVGDRVAATAIWGGFAQQLVVPEADVTKIPDSMDFTTAAGVMLTYGTSYHALVDRARIQPGETLLVLGAAGGVGLAAVQLGKALGARVIGAASSAMKVALVKEHGAEDCINYRQDDLKQEAKRLTDGKGADVIYDAVGGAATDAVMSAINWQGRLLVVGFASGQIPSIALNRVLLKGCGILGVFWGDFVRREPERSMANNKKIMDLFEAGRIKPLISATYPLERVADALHDIESRKATGKIVLTTGL